MARFVKGDVVVVPFPFSDLSESKRRPALIVATFEDDLLLCQITSQQVRDRYALILRDEDFISGSLKKISNIRPNRIFSASQEIILYKIGALSRDKIAAVIEKIIELLRA